MHPDPDGSPPPPRSDTATPEDEGEVLARVLTLKEHDEPQVSLDDSGRVELVRYDPVRHYLLEIASISR